MTATPDSPVAVARLFFRVLEEERWDDAVALVDPAVVQAHYDWWRSGLAVSGGRHAITIETGVRPAAEHPAASSMRVMVASRFLPGGIEGEQELDALTPTEAMVRATIHLQQAMAEARANAPRPRRRTGQSDEPEIEPRTMNVVVGDVQETDNLAHVVYRCLLQRGERTTMVEPIEVLSLRRTADGWRVRDPHKFGLGHQGFRPHATGQSGIWRRAPGV